MTPPVTTWNLAHVVRTFTKGATRSRNAQLFGVSRIKMSCSSPPPIRQVQKCSQERPRIILSSLFGFHQLSAVLFRWRLNAFREERKKERVLRECKAENPSARFDIVVDKSIGVAIIASFFFYLSLSLFFLTLSISLPRILFVCTCKM